MKTATKPAQPDLLAPAAEVIPPARKATKKTEVATVAPRSAPAPTNLLAIIASAAADPRVDVQKMKELLAIQREIEQAQQSAEFNRAFLAAQEEMPRIVKDRANTHTKSSYATLEKVSTEIDHIARKHGFAGSFGTADSPLPNHYRIICDLSHTGGHTRRYFIDLESDSSGAKGTSNKTPVQGVGSTMSYGRRYLKVMMFDLTIVGEDTDGNKQRGGKTTGADDREALISRPQFAELAVEIETCGVGVKKFCEKFGIEKVPDLPASKYEDSLQACRNFAAAKKAKQSNG